MRERAREREKMYSIQVHSFGEEKKKERKRN